MIFKGFITNCSPNYNEEFFSPDTEKRFIENQKKVPNDWEYNYIKINYSLNDYGFRCISSNQLEDDYILFSGCSLTFGSALKLEHTYPFLVAKHFNKTYYNLAVGGSDIELFIHNMIMFFSKVKKLPKCIVIQWPYIQRFHYFENGQHLQMSCNLSDDNEILKFFLQNLLAYNKNIFYKYFLIEYLQDLGIKYIIADEEKQQVLHDTTNIISYDLEKNLFNNFNYPKARDLSHPGIIPHKLHSIMLIDLIKSHNIFK